MPPRHVFLGSDKHLLSLFFGSISSPYQCVLHCSILWILPQPEQQVFAGRNSDTWMRTVRLLIRESAPPLSPHLKERRAHKHTNTCMQVHKAAGGHYQLDKSKQAKSTPAHWTLVGNEREVESISKQYQSVEVLGCCFFFSLNFCTSVCDIPASKLNVLMIKTK